MSVNEIIDFQWCPNAQVWTFIYEDCRGKWWSRQYSQNQMAAQCTVPIPVRLWWR